MCTQQLAASPAPFSPHLRHCRIIQIAVGLSARHCCEKPLACGGPYDPQGPAVQYFRRSHLAQFACIFTVLASLSACGAPPEESDLPEPGVREATTNGPAGAAPGSCWGRTVSPAVIETVTEQVQVQPAQISSTGEIQSLPIYRTETRQKIVSPRVDNWFETPCTSALTPDVIATLQRALEARGFYGGAISSQLDDATRSAMRAYQVSTAGPDSPVLALTTARSLGVIAVHIPGIDTKIEG